MNLEEKLKEVVHDIKIQHQPKGLEPSTIKTIQETSNFKAV